MRKDSIQDWKKNIDCASDNCPQRLLQWYWQVKRDLPWRRTGNPYHIWISEVMLQQTQVKTVIPYYHNFLEKFPDISALAHASLEEVLELWRGLGYYSRAKNLWQGARYVLETLQGKMPGTYQELLKIPGVGEYTGGAVASIAYGERVPAIDGNVKRVVARFLAWEEEIESVKSRRQILQHLEAWQPSEHAGDFNQALMELGATVCTPKAPKCLACPLQQGCLAFAQGNPLIFPVKRTKVKITEAVRPTLILLHHGKVLLKKRPAEGLLANLWEFPGEEYRVENRAPGLAAERQARYGNTNDQADPERMAEPVLDPIREDGGFPWLDLYHNQVADRTFDQAVEDLLREKPRIRGPYIHTFSHRRWSIYWLVLDLDRALPGRNNGERYPDVDAISDTKANSEVEADLEANSDAHVDADKDKKADPEAEQSAVYRWLDLAELDKIALPVAFQKVWALCLAGQ